ncbi:MAG: hypothetical protein GWN31_08330 [Candidatus Thorarchaeota archaeon]|nr:hypothetical protein [Candidatus Thorarchaeota archaeon]NIW13924.1 hypothetical protein [Candidatus Thorarchaeota archaeon]NIW52043.1 hypothetical protein [Candidatus Korarchaeota archaeon]
MNYHEVTEGMAETILALHGRDQVADSVQWKSRTSGSAHEYHWFLREGYSLLLEWNQSTGERYWWEVSNDR